jgi:predicted transcriptional regulator
MDAVWSGGEMSVRDVQDGLEGRAYTTLMTTMDRLHRKGLLVRRRQGKAFLYRARLTPDELRRGTARGLLAGLLAPGEGDARPILSCLVDAVSERDRALLHHLSQLVRRKRRELGDEEP